MRYKGNCSQSYSITAEKLENGNGFMYAIDGTLNQPNYDIGETEHNQTGYATKQLAIEAGKATASFMDGFIQDHGW